MRHYILDEKYWVNKNYVLRLFFFSKFYNTRFKCNLENLPEKNYPLESKIDFKKKWKDGTSFQNTSRSPDQHWRRENGKVLMEI